ncbi:Transposon Tn7 transposition protein TnsB [compost metagenome]
MRETLTKGQLVLFEGRKCKIVSFDKTQGVLVEDRNDGSLSYASPEQLTGLDTSDKTEELKKSLQALWFDDSRVTPEQRRLASKRETAFISYRSNELSRVEAAISVGMSVSQFNRVLKKYRPELGAISILGVPRGRKKGTRLLSAEVEAVIDFCIQTYYRGRGATLEIIYQQVDTKCTLNGFTTPSRGAVTKRFYEVPAFDRCRMKYGIEVAKQKFKMKTGSKKVLHALDFVQIDHTMVDCFILDDARVPLMRPWITMLIDLRTRVVLGYYISLCPPSAISCAMALVNAVFPKTNALLEFNDPDIRYICYGLMKVIHSDNASEFKSEIFEAACRAYGIDPVLRPLGAKHFGGHIERLIGTFMGKVHFLRGSTQSNVVKRGEIDPATQATRTLDEFELWFARSASIYHDTVHRSLEGHTPFEVWIEDMTTPSGQDIMPPTPTDPRTFALDFFPQDHRVVSPKGILFKWRYYDDQILRDMSRETVYFKYDPRDLSRLFLKVNGFYHDIILCDLMAPPMSENKLLLQSHEKRIKSGTVRSEASHRLREKNNEQDIQTEKETKRARKKRNADAKHAKKTQSVIGPPALPAPSIPAVKEIDPTRQRRKLRWED